LIKTKEKDLLQLPEPIMDEIIERAFNKVHRSQQARHAIDLIVKFMLKIKGLANVFDLLNIEKSKARD
jgi:hydroxymethylpyrimidine pyrophosphatase-like HAD family hydrolase